VLGQQRLAGFLNIPEDVVFGQLGGWFQNTVFGSTVS
jgi:hypothetical protein